MSIPPAILETARLVLRPPVLDDADAIFRKYAQDPEVTKYLVWRPHESIVATRVFIRRCIQCRKDGTAFPWVIARQQDDELAGMLELRIDGFRADLGYVIAQKYWGNGYATEVTKAMVEWALLQQGIYRVWATCDIEKLLF